MLGPLSCELQKQQKTCLSKVSAHCCWPQPPLPAMTQQLESNFRSSSAMLYTPFLYACSCGLRLHEPKVFT
jgi:hypothetical protein